MDDDFQQIIIAIEGQLYVECRSFVNAIYLMLVSHYVFDIEYNARAKDVLFFLQENMLGLQDPKFRKSANYSSVSSAILCHLADGMDQS